MAHLDGEVTEIDLERETLRRLMRRRLHSGILQSGELDAPMLRFACAFAAADEIVVAEPYWDLSFPSAIKNFLSILRKERSDKMETKEFKQGEVIFKEGTLGSVMYEIKSGTVGIFAAYGTSDEKKLTELADGRIFGEMGVIEVRPRSATAVALSDVEAVEVSTADMQEYFSSQPEKLMEIMRGMSARLRELTADFQEVCGVIGDWDEATKLKKEKSSGLFSAIRKFAAAYAESMKHVSNDEINPYMYY